MRRITKQQLKQIIREERARLIEQELNWSSRGLQPHDEAIYKEAWDQLADVVSKLGYSEGTPNLAAQAAIYNALTEVANALNQEIQVPSYGGSAFTTAKEEL